MLLLFRGYMLKYLGVKDHPVYNLFSNGSEKKKNVHIYIERKKPMNVVNVNNWGTCVKGK